MSEWISRWHPDCRSCSQIRLSAQLPLMPHLIKGCVMAGLPAPIHRGASLYGNEPETLRPSRARRVSLTNSRTNHPRCSDGNLAPDDSTTQQLSRLNAKKASLFWLHWAVNYMSQEGRVNPRPDINTLSRAPGDLRREDEAEKTPATAEQLLILRLCVDGW